MAASSGSPVGVVAPPAGSPAVLTPAVSLTSREVALTTSMAEPRAAGGAVEVAEHLAVQHPARSTSRTKMLKVPANWPLPAVTATWSLSPQAPGLAAVTVSAFFGVPAPSMRLSDAARVAGVREPHHPGDRPALLEVLQDGVARDALRVQARRRPG